MKKVVSCVGIGVCVFSAAYGQVLELASPESQGVSSRAILKWIEACENDALTNRFGKGYVHGFVILRHGKTIAEGTWAPQDTLNVPHMLYSHSKSFTSTAVGFLVDDGKIDLDRRVVSFFPEQTPTNASENLRQVRVRDLLTMNLGADHTDAERDDITGDWVRALLANPIDREPGTGFKYDSGATHLLAAIVEKVSGKPLMSFLKERLFDPLGMTSPWSTVSPTGIACGGWGMHMTTRDLARFGQFLLQEGAWGGRQLLSREWVRLATSRQTWSGSIVIQSQTIGSGSDWDQGYGFQFWRCRHDAYRADGASGQLTIVMPAQDAVVSVHAGLGDMQRELDLVWQHLLPAFAATPQAEDPEACAVLRRKCSSLALPLEGNSTAVFEGLDSAEVKATDSGWILEKDGRTLAVGKDTWAVTDWTFDETNVEPLYGNCGTRQIAAVGRSLPNGNLSVTWQFLGGIRHGRFEVRTSSDVLPAWRKGEAQFHFIHTGVGESVFVIYPDGTSMLIDCGDHEAVTRGKLAVPVLPNADRLAGEWVARYVERVNPRTNQVDYLVVSHFHSDHTGVGYWNAGKNAEGVPLSGFALAAETLHFRKAVDRGFPDYKTPFAYDPSAVESRDLMLPLYRYLEKRDGLVVERFDLGSVEQFKPLYDPGLCEGFGVLNFCGNGMVVSRDGHHDLLANWKRRHPSSEPYNENGLSLGMVFSMGPFRLFTAGDFSARAEDEQGQKVKIEDLVAPFVPVCDVAKITHHGHHSMTESLLKALGARVIVSSVWDQLHNTDDTLARVSAHLSANGGMFFPTVFPKERIQKLGEVPSVIPRSCTNGVHVVVTVAPGGKRYRVSTVRAKDELMVVEEQFDLSAKAGGGTNE